MLKSAVTLPNRGVTPRLLKIAQTIIRKNEMITVSESALINADNALLLSI